jgi:hypothetical protein
MASGNRASPKARGQPIGVLCDRFVKEAGFARAEKVESREEWISAAAAAQLLTPVFKGRYSAQMRICARAHAGLVRARAEHFKLDKRSENDFDIPKAFWWSEGHEALKQNWEAGDLDTWIEEKHLRAFGVKFLRTDIEKLIPKPPPVIEPTAMNAAPGGRPRADWWEDLWVEMCRQIYDGGELNQAKTQADVERVMLDFLAKSNVSPAETTIRPRAKKLWNVIKAKN